MSAMIMVQLMEWEYALAEGQKWQEHISHDCAVHQI